jgi:hypothetical protein
MPANPNKSEPKFEIVIDMIKKEDAEGRTYLFANPDLPISVPLDQCFFIVFTADHPCLIIRKQEKKLHKRLRAHPED